MKGQQLVGMALNDAEDTTGKELPGTDRLLECLFVLGRPVAVDIFSPVQTTPRKKCHACLYTSFSRKAAKKSKANQSVYCSSSGLKPRVPENLSTPLPFVSVRASTPAPCSTILIAKSKSLLIGVSASFVGERQTRLFLRASSEVCS